MATAHRLISSQGGNVFKILQDGRNPLEEESPALVANIIKKLDGIDRYRAPPPPPPRPPPPPPPHPPPTPPPLSFLGSRLVREPK